MSVSSLASQQRAMRPHAGMERVRWMFAQPGDHHRYFLPRKIGNASSFKQAFSVSRVLGVGVLNGREILFVKWEDRP